MSEINYGKELAIATLAAGIITARRATKVEDIEAAWLDASMIAFPLGRSNPKYKEWQLSHGLTPTTLEEDKARAETRAEANRKAGDAIRGAMRSR